MFGMRLVVFVLALMLAPATAGAACKLVDGHDRVIQKTVALTNAERQRRSRIKLSANPRLNAAARAHACDMATRGYFSHTGKDGTSVGNRADRAGYRYRMIAENIALGHDRPTRVMKGWMGSAGHRRNILALEMRDIGMAVATNGRELYWVMVLGVRP